MQGLAAAVAFVAAVMVAPVGHAAQQSAWSVALPSLPIAPLLARDAALPGNRTFRIGDCDLVVAEAWGLVSGGVRGTGAVLHAFFTLFVFI